MEVIKLNATSSTNTYLKNWAFKNPTKNEAAVWTIHQTEGRGQQGAAWYSEPGKSLACSLLKRFELAETGLLPKLQFAVALAVREALIRFDVPKVQLKWPNDILSDSKKLCGILIENRWQENQQLQSIVGIGINVNQTAFPLLPKATSMLLETAQQYDVEAVFEVINDTVMMELRKLQDCNAKALRQAYEEHLFRKGMVSAFEKPDGTRFEGVIQGVSPNGALAVTDLDGIQHHFQHKEITLRY